MPTQNTLGLLRVILSLRFRIRHDPTLTDYRVIVHLYQNNQHNKSGQRKLIPGAKRLDTALTVEAMVYIKVGCYHVKKSCIQYFNETEDGYIVHFGEGAHAQTVTLNKEEGMALLQALEDLSDIT